MDGEARVRCPPDEARRQCAEPLRVAVPRRLAQAPLKEIGSCPVVKASHADGTKFYLGNDNWALVRFSGTEPILRLFVEADSPDKASTLIQHLREFVTK